MTEVTRFLEANKAYAAARASVADARPAEPAAEASPAADAQEVEFVEERHQGGIHNLDDASARNTDRVLTCLKQCAEQHRCGLRVEVGYCRMSDCAIHGVAQRS